MTSIDSRSFALSRANDTCHIVNLPLEIKYAIFEQLDCMQTANELRATCQILHAACDKNIVQFYQRKIVGQVLDHYRNFSNQELMIYKVPETVWKTKYPEKTRFVESIIQLLPQYTKLSTRLFFLDPRMAAAADYDDSMLGKERQLLELDMRGVVLMDPWTARVYERNIDARFTPFKAHSWSLEMFFKLMQWRLQMEREQRGEAYEVRKRKTLIQNETSGSFFLCN